MNRHFSNNHNHNADSWVFRISPKRLLLIMAVTIFLVETSIMLIFNELPPLSREFEALLDSTILLLLLTPFYLLIYRPFWDERQRQAKQIRQLSQKLLLASEEESKRIAQDIHDQCGQSLTALQFNLQSLKKQAEQCDPKFLNHVEYTEAIAAQLADEMRQVSASLRPAILDQLGLVAAIESMIEDLQQNYPQIEIKPRLLQRAILLKQTPPSLENALYRICQEALTNVVKHASATSIEVTLVQNDSLLELTVTDDGIGFAVGDDDERQGVGLIGMRERAYMAGGTLHVESEPGRGTSIRFSCRYHRRKADDTD